MLEFQSDSLHFLLHTLSDFNILMLFRLFLKDGSTALFKAAIKGHDSVIEELLKFSPSLGLLKVEDAVCF